MSDTQDDKGVDGDLSHFSIFDITHTLMMSRKTALVTVERRSRKGFLYFKDGQIISAIDDDLRTGEQAAFQIFLWKTGRFKMEFDVAPRERNIKLDTENLLLEIARNLDENTRDELIGDDEDETARTVEEQFQDKFRNELTRVFDKVANESTPTRDRYTVSAFDSLLLALNDLGGTALFLRPGAKPRIKSDSGFTTIKQDVVSSNEINGFLNSLLSSEEARELATHHEVSVYYSCDGAGTFRVRGFHDCGRPAIIFSPASKSIPALSRLVPNASDLDQVFASRSGLYLLAGPLASGKTTLLTALLEDALRQRDLLVTLFGRTETYEFTEEGGFLIRADLHRFSLDLDGGLQGAIDQGSDVIAVDEISSGPMLETACLVAARSALVLATCEADDLVDLSRRLQRFAQGDEQSRIMRRLGQCLRGVAMVDLASDDGAHPRLVLHTLDDAGRARVSQGDFSALSSAPQLV